MKIAILTSGILPVPSVQGGAVENFLDFFLEYNDIHRIHTITVYSIYHPKVDHHPALESQVNNYYFINTTSWFAKIKKHIFGILYKDLQYHFSIEYFLREAMRHILKCNYDVIILNNRPGYADVLAGKTNAKLVYNLYNDKLNNTTKAHQKIYDAASLIISTSEYITNRVKTIGDSANKCVTVYSGIELDRFVREQKNDIALPSRFGFDKKDFLMVFSGRVTQEKGIMELIDAMLLLKNKPNIKLMIIGSSFYGNANNENDFAKTLKAKAEPLKERIIFTGFIPYQEMPSYLQIADVAVIPSVWDDPFPTTVLEAQAMGLPIISTRRGGIPEETTEDAAILLTTDENFVSNLAKSILDLYNNPKKREQMSKAALKHSKQFSKEHYAQNFFKALESI